MLVMMLRTVTTAGDLPLVLVVDDRIGGRPLPRQLLVEPLQRWRDTGILIAQAIDQLHKERFRVCRLGVLRQHSVGRFGRAAPRAQQSVGQSIRRASAGAAVHDPLGDPPEVFDQHDPQRDGYGPKLADGQRLDLLIGAQVAAQDLGVEEAVGMGHERPGRAEHARVSHERSAGELGQLPIVARGQIGPDFADLFLDHMEVVDQPLGRRGDDRSGVDGLRDFAIGRKQHGLVFGKSFRQWGALPFAGHHPLRGGEAARVFFQTFDAEQLRPDGRAVVPRRMGTCIAQEAAQRRDQCTFVA